MRPVPGWEVEHEVDSSEDYDNIVGKTSSNFLPARARKVQALLFEGKKGQLPVVFHYGEGRGKYPYFVEDNSQLDLPIEEQNALNAAGELVVAGQNDLPLEFQLDLRPMSGTLEYLKEVHGPTWKPEWEVISQRHINLRYLLKEPKGPTRHHHDQWWHHGSVHCLDKEHSRQYTLGKVLAEWSRLEEISNSNGSDDPEEGSVVPSRDLLQSSL